MQQRGRVRAYGWRSAAIMAAGCLLATGCSGSSGPRSSPTTAHPSGAEATSTTSTASGQVEAPEQYSGPIEDFYRVPKPLAKGAPGQLIRTMALPAGEAGTTSLRIMYHSIDANGRDRAVTGVVTYPTATAPKGGWPVVTTAHGTTGIASPCAPSRWLTSAPAYGIDGVRVETDYIGLGPIGELHPYLSGIDEGHSVIDAVRAARLLPDAHAGRRYVVWGHSQGGHAAIWANQLGKAYAPELDLLGTAALAPAAELTKTYGPVDEIVANVVSLMALYGNEPEHPEIDPDDYVGPAVKKLERLVKTTCLDKITTAFVPIDAATFYAHRPQDTKPARSLIVDSDPGKVAVEAPLLLVQGDQDIRVAPGRTEDLFARLCKTGQVTEYHLFPGTDHDTVIGASTTIVERWLADRLEGKAPSDSCRAGKATVER